MNIAFYKPGKKVYFHDDSEDYAAWSYEITNLMRIFAKFGHSCYILSESDYFLKALPNIFIGSFDMRYDRTFFFSGVYNDNTLQDLKNIKSDNIDFYFTDLRLLPPKQYFKYFRKIYSVQREYPGRFYAGNNESYLFQQEIRPLIHKDIKCYYGGGERNRLKKIFEYVLRPDVVWTGRSPYFNIDTRIYNRKEYLNFMDRVKYSICIVDEDYTQTTALTQRHYEHILHNIVSFVDNDFDLGCHMIPKDAWYRVNTYQDMYEKMRYLDENPIKYDEMLLLQRANIKNDYINGKYVYSLLQ
jgi:hypothetical protein